MLQWASTFLNMWKFQSQFLDFNIFVFQLILKLCDFLNQINSVHFSNFILFVILFELIIGMIVIFLKIFNLNFQNVKLIIFLIKFIVSFHRLLSKNSQLLLKILYTIIGGEHFLLLLRFVLDLRKLFFDFFDVIAISKEKFSLVFFDYMLNYAVHDINCGMDLIVKLINLIDGFFVVKFSWCPGNQYVTGYGLSRNKKIHCMRMLMMLIILLTYWCNVLKRFRHVFFLMWHIFDFFIQ